MADTSNAIIRFVFVSPSFIISFFLFVPIFLFLSFLIFLISFLKSIRSSIASRRNDSRSIRFDSAFKRSNQSSNGEEIEELEEAEEEEYSTSIRVSSSMIDIDDDGVGCLSWLCVELSLCRVALLLHSAIDRDRPKLT